ncbi:hypothetical protein BGW42_002702 [Actinomortierella wolfii]|nr:hypothetical protein BGW42_002702 [Actinomortierella wolfii]
MGKIVQLTPNIEYQYENDNTPIMTQHQSSNTTSSGRPAERALRSAPIPTLAPTSPVRPGFQQGGGGGGYGGGGRQGGGGGGGGGSNPRRYNTTHHGQRSRGGGGGGGGGRYPQQQQYPSSPSYNNSQYSSYPSSPSSPSFSNYPPTPTTPLPAYQELNMYVERPTPVAQPPQYTARNMVYPGGHGNGSSSNLYNNGYDNHHNQYYQQQQQYNYSGNTGRGGSDPRYAPPYRSNSGGSVHDGYPPPKRQGLPTDNSSGAYYPMRRTATQRQQSMRHDDDRVGEGWMCCKEVAGFCPCCCFCCIFAGMGVAG